MAQPTRFGVTEERRDVYNRKQKVAGPARGREGRGGVDGEEQQEKKAFVDPTHIL